MSEINHPNQIKIRCMLFGHVGDETESGHHVCGHCGMHSYYGEEDYGVAGLVTSPPLFWLIRLHLWGWIWQFRLDHQYLWQEADDNLPF